MAQIFPFFLVLAGTGAAMAAPVSFQEETIASGVSHTYDGGPAHFVGGGVAAFDCDNDHFPDLYLAGGENPAGLFRNVSAPGGALRFRAVGDETVNLTAVTGAYPLNVDGDEFVDLFVMRVGENVLLRGRGDCRFERNNEAWRFDGGTAPTTAFAAVWEEGRGRPTVVEGNYISRDSAGNPVGACQPNRLFRPKKAAPTYGPPISLSPSHCPLSMLFSDWRGDGSRDLWISNDRQYYGPDGSEQLWRFSPDGAPPRAYTPADGWQRLRIWGMGIASHDVTGDGRPDYYLTSMADNKLRTHAALTDAPVYEDSALAWGVTAHRPSVGDTSRPSTSWHAEFGDVDNDGRFDLFVVKGNVDAMEDFALEDPNALFLRQADGTFLDVAPDAGIASPARGRGGALVDLNLDGTLDLVVNNRGTAAQLWRNTSAAGNWLQVRLVQDGPNRDTIGAWIEVTVDSKTARRELTVGGGHASGQLGWAHFGLGSAASARVTIRWPDGALQGWELPANAFAEIHRNDAAVTFVKPERSQ